MDEGKVFLTMLGVLAGAVVVLFIYNAFIKKALLKGKSIAGKAESVLKKDMSSKCSRCTFYMNNDYANGYSQKEWMDLYEERVSSKEWDKKSEEYAEAVAPFVNAIVVGDDGYLVRRGMENMVNSLERFQAGINDSISLNYFVEPYEYVKDEKRAVLSEMDNLIRKIEYEKKAPERAAMARCRNCIHEHSCDWKVKRQTGNCGGYTPKEKKRSFL